LNIPSSFGRLQAAGKVKPKRRKEARAFSGGDCNWIVAKVRALLDTTSKAFFIYLRGRFDNFFGGSSLMVCAWRSTIFRIRAYSSPMSLRFCSISEPSLRFLSRGTPPRYALRFGCLGDYTVSMSENTLMEVDLKISQIREQLAAGKASITSGVELDALLQERAKLIAQKIAPKEQELSSRP
jgi:hypothetical protein